MTGPPANTGKKPHIGSGPENKRLNNTTIITTAVLGIFRDCSFLKKYLKQYFKDWKQHQFLRICTPNKTILFLKLVLK